ncbi:hypothetical protein DL771_001600 [Monosporascus sp. 5C6A]|nr:hypothetical protein DL771_001600 [Monosporascus sp. 5C6A]
MAPVYASAGGTAVVGSGVSYSQKGAVVASPGANEVTRVYVPVTNPQNTSDKLTKVSVECLGTSAEATEIYVYFGDKLILDANPTDGSKTFDINTTTQSSQADSQPYGIDVSMDVSFSSAAGTFEIYSVTLQFGS